MAQTLSKSQEKIVPPTIPPIDQLVNSQQMRMIKAALPYMDFPQQKKVAMFIKLIEFRKTIDIFDSPDQVHTTLHEKKSLDKLEFLKDIRNSCDEPSQKKLNMLISLLNMQSTMDIMKTNALSAQIDPYKNTSQVSNSDSNSSNSYNEFMNMVNKIIDEKDGAGSGF
jgi:hypothetical protein